MKNQNCLLIRFAEKNPRSKVDTSTPKNPRKFYKRLPQESWELWIKCPSSPTTNTLTSKAREVLHHFTPGTYTTTPANMFYTKPWTNLLEGSGGEDYIPKSEMSFILCLH
jgi:hypothetical protein